MTDQSPLIVGIDVGGTNTDAVLLRVADGSNINVVAAHKAPTTSNVTISVRDTLQALLDKSTINSGDISALAIGTTHFLNAIIERDSSRVEKVAVIRLASYNFSKGQPTFSAWPKALKNVVNGHTAIIPGGCNITGDEIAPIDENAVKEQVEIIKSKELKNVVIVGIGSPMDKDHHQENRVKDIIRTGLGPGVNIVCSHDVAGAGLLARENASILNASILNFARRTIRSFIGAMSKTGLHCPLYLSSNEGHLLPFSEALKYPIAIFSSGATNSIRGAALLAGDQVEQKGCIVVDIGGTTTDVGYLLKNGYPRLAKSYTDLAGVKINLQMPSVESIGLGGGSLLHVADGKVTIGPESVGHDILTDALCFGGGTPTATDVAAASGADIGTSKADLPEATIVNAKASIKRMLELVIDRTKFSPEPCAVILVGGGSILCPDALEGVSRIIVPEHAGVANAIGAAMAKVSGSAEFVVRTDNITAEIARAKALAVKDAVSRGGDQNAVTVLNEQANGVPYSDGETNIRVEVALAADHARVHKELLDSVKEDPVQEEELYEETKTHEADTEDVREKIELKTYTPSIDPDGIWSVSKTDLDFLSIGCYILGCGGGGSPYGVFLEVAQLLEEGETVKIKSLESLTKDDILPPIAAVGTPAVSIERPGGDSMLHALAAMSDEMHLEYTTMLTTEIGGSNGLQALEWGSSKYYNIPTVDADQMGRAYPSYEMCSAYVTATSINDLLPVTLCSGTGNNVVIPANQTSQEEASLAIRTAVFSMGVAACGVSRPLDGVQAQRTSIPNSYSLAWRLGRVVSIAQQTSSLSSVPNKIIEECGGNKSAKRLFTGKIRSVESSLTTTAHSVGKVIIERLSDNEIESADERQASYTEVHIPFMNENLAILAKSENGEEMVLATAPDLIFLLDVSTGEAIGVQEYRYGLKVTVMIVAPHPIWVTERGLQLVGPGAFGLEYEYTSSLVYTKPRSVIEEFGPNR
ncbi:hydantoinase/oxoprolinase [Bisporella sp. PMI_857]|nr:hydantoinase/oxoprolinase [Bisporella sp. PMI_857]